MSDEPKTVSFDRPKLERLKKRFNRAVEVGETQFEFEGGDYLTSYAKYMIEYLERQLPK